MSPRKWFLSLTLFLSFTILHQVSAQNATDVPEKAIEAILGKWQLQKVYAGSREIATNPNSQGQWIEFNEDGKYTLHAEDSDHGSYRLNETQSTLYLESEEQKETSSAVSAKEVTEYNITLRDDMLTMQSKESGSPTKYVYAKRGE